MSDAPYPPYPNYDNNGPARSTDARASILQVKRNTFQSLDFVHYQREDNRNIYNDVAANTSYLQTHYIKHGGRDNAIYSAYVELWFKFQEKLHQCNTLTLFKLADSADRAKRDALLVELDTLIKSLAENEYVLNRIKGQPPTARTGAFNVAMYQDALRGLIK
jgi:hypothetical protein